MDITTISIIGVAVAFNVIIILWKFNHNRIFDGLLDSTLLILVAMLFKGTVSGLIIGTIASAIISLYLLAFPPKQFDISLWK